MSSSRRRRWLLAGGLLLVGSLVVAWWWMIRMPGPAFHGTVPEPDERLRALSRELRRDVERLAGEIGERNLRHFPELQAAADFVEAELQAAGLSVERQEYQVRGHACHNLVAERKGSRTPDEIVLVGAHYDSAPGTPGANDNASGIAALLALARRFAARGPTGKTLRFVAFTNEEPPHFQTENMGSLVYARACRRRGDQLVAVLSLETMGYYRHEPDTQHYPPPMGLLYSDEGNFLAIVGNVGSRPLVHRVIAAFRRQQVFASEGAAVPDILPGVGWSDHWSFWQEGYSGVMLTDTAPFRYPYYHRPEDTPDKVHFDDLARVVAALEPVVAELAE